VWTSNIGNTSRIAARLGFGCAGVTHLPLIDEMPRRGCEHSGYGKVLSMYGLEGYTRIKHVMIHHGLGG
jgi:acyl-CoA reductase-like NAD-dependent aldehyde dehydrogenase